MKKAKLEDIDLEQYDILYRLMTVIMQDNGQPIMGGSYTQESWDKKYKHLEINLYDECLKEGTKFFATDAYPKED